VLFQMAGAAAASCSPILLCSPPNCLRVQAPAPKAAAQKLLPKSRCQSRSPRGAQAGGKGQAPAPVPLKGARRPGAAPGVHAAITGPEPVVRFRTPLPSSGFWS